MPGRGGSHPQMWLAAGPARRRPTVTVEQGGKPSRERRAWRPVMPGGLAMQSTDVHPCLSAAQPANLRSAHHFIQRCIGAGQHAALPQQQAHAVALALRWRRNKCGGGGTNAVR